MSSDEESSASPIIPKDSDHGSSVSSDFQDEYDELLRYAVVTPKFGPHLLRQHQPAAEQTSSDRFSGLTETGQERTPARQTTASTESSNESFNKSLTSELKTTVSGSAVPKPGFPAPDIRKSVEAFSPVRSEGLSLQGSASSTDFHTEQIRVMELPVSTENMNHVENVLDFWSGNLKTNVLAELSKWRLTIIEQHKQEMKKQDEKHAEHITKLSSQVDNLEELLETYTTSIQRKDEVISNLTRALEKQKEKTELMRTFTHWRLQHLEARQEDYASSMADKHYQKTLMKNVWRAWHSAIESDWKEKVEQACRTRAEEVCVELSNGYESQITQLSGALEEARAEVQRLHAERGQFEGSMKKAFMRGVCALNMEAMSMFQGRESRMDDDPAHRREDLGSNPSVTFQHPMTSSDHDLPSRFHPASSEPTYRPPFGAPCSSQSKESANTPVIFSVTAPGSGAIPAQKLPSARIVTSSQQKAGRTITARITARSDLTQKMNKVGSSVGSMAVSPPMSSVVVEKHHPVTQQTISQATAAKYPRTSLQSASSMSGRSTSQSGRTAHPSVHSIKVVD
ncbi:centrosomal protein POC5 [Spea bombifrons]|uniref:centrosomal protein POC5 n=1 Tax=Spea bombifrons TaxID=233779 RepID=UPI00234BB18A|nr:centrosomal protein POC5 [Spea bombifrons]